MLLCADLGDPDARPLTLRQLQTLGRRARLEAGKPGPEKVTQALLQSWGYEPRMAARIEGLLAREKLLDHYLMGAARLGVSLRTRIDPQYPRRLWRILGQDAPPVLALWGDESLLERPCISVVGSREPSPREEEFSRQAGRQAAALFWCPGMPGAVTGWLRRLASGRADRSFPWWRTSFPPTARPPKAAVFFGSGREAMTFRFRRSAP